MSIRTRLRAIERQRQKKSGGLFYVTDNLDGSYTHGGARYPNLDAVRRIAGYRSGDIFSFQKCRRTTRCRLNWLRTALAVAHLHESLSTPRV